jgi:flagellar hook-length control protein FliK
MIDRQVEVVRQIAKQIGLRSAAQADQRISMLLKPESLGAVRLDLSFEDDGSLSIDASVEESATRRLIASAVEELRTSLKSEGFQLNRLTVTEQASVATNGHGGPALGDNTQGSNAQAGQGRGRGRGNSQQSGAAQAQAVQGRRTDNEEQNTGRLRLGDVDLTA